MSGLFVLADENFPGPVVRELRERGHDVAWVRDDMQGAADSEVLERAQAEGRTVITQDKDFGELAFHAGLPAGCGVVLLRLSGESPRVDNARAISALESRDDWRGCFSVVEAERIRMRPLPES